MTAQKHYTYKWPALLGICLLAFTAFLDNTIVSTALPFIQRAFKINILQLQWVANIFPIVISMSMIAAGKLGDFFGAKKVFYVGVVIFGLAALFAGFCTTIFWLTVFRGVQALGASLSFISSSALVSETFVGEERTWAIGIYGGISGAGLMLGPFVGGILVGALDWRWVFWINVPLIILGLFLCFMSLRIPRERQKDVHFDVKGLSLLIFGLGSTMYGIISLANDKSFLVLSWAFLLLGLFSLALLLYIDKRTKHPLLNLSMFKNKLIILAVLSCAVAGCVSYVFMFFSPLLLKDVFDLSSYKIGALIAVIPLAQVMISFGFKSMFKKLGLANLFVISTLAPFLSAILLLFVSSDTPLWFFIFPYALLGVNWGLSNTATITAVNQELKPSQVGEGIGTNGTIWNMSGAFLLAISSAVFHSQPSEFLLSFRLLMGLNGAFILLALLFCFALRSKISRS